MIETFIDKIIDNQEVYILEYKDEIAVAESVLFQNDVQEPVPVICFWSDKETALKCAKDVWKNYKIQDICLVTFIEDYLVNVYNESLIVGVNFDDELKGIEADPLELINEIIKKLKVKKLNLEFEYFKNLNDLESQLHKLM